MNFSQRITQEDKNKLVRFMVLLTNIAAVINTILNIICITVEIIALFLVLLGFFNSEIKAVHIIMLIMLDVAFSDYRKRWKEQKSFKYIKNLDKSLSATDDIPYYDIKADDEAVTVNESFSLKWKDVYAAAFTKDFVILSSKKKTAVMIQADDELKLQIGEILNNNKTQIYCIVKTSVNKQIAKPSEKRRVTKTLKKTVVYLIIASLPIAYLMTAKSPIKDLTQGNIALMTVGLNLL